MKINQIAINIHKYVFGLKIVIFYRYCEINFLITKSSPLL